MRIRRRPLRGYDQLFWYGAFMVGLLAFGLVLNACSPRTHVLTARESYETTQMECRSNGRIWSQGRCWAPAGVTEAR